MRTQTFQNSSKNVTDFWKRYRLYKCLYKGLNGFKLKNIMDPNIISLISKNLNVQSNFLGFSKICQYFYVFSFILKFYF